MPVAGFEPTIPVFERAKTIHASDRATTVTGTYLLEICVSSVQEAQAYDRSND
jgi:hypothetical protein